MGAPRNWLGGGLARAMAGTGRGGLALMFALGVTAARAQTIPAEWLRNMPGPREAAALEQGAAIYGWAAMGRALRAAAYAPYLTNNLELADAWRDAARWAEAWADPVMAERMGAELRAWVLAHAGFSAEFFALEQPADDRARVFGILHGLHARDARGFADHAALALAIALVYDTPPPREWPHWQVTEGALPRRLPLPAAAFDFFIEGQREGLALHRLDKLDAGELRFLVDLAAAPEELRWARARLRTPLARLDETYSMINYRVDRAEAGVYVWPWRSYALDEILREGGICVDQAYFATQAGKARGVPTLLFGGAGRDGRHAWFGYLGTGGKWVMDAGRYEEQRFVTGEALDPQTWNVITDHELAFLSEGFWHERSAREAATHAGFAEWFLADGKPQGAERAARTAVRLERRVIAGWEVLLALRSGAGAEREAVAREAAGALSAYPELQARFLRVVIESLRARGEAKEAERLGAELARRFAKKRGDLSVAQFAEQLARAAETGTGAEQMRLYRGLLRRFGRGEGAAWWDVVVRPFVGRLVEAGRIGEARVALGVARDELGAAGGSQLDAEMRAADEALAAEELAAEERAAAKRAR